MPYCESCDFCWNKGTVKKQHFMHECRIRDAHFKAMYSEEPSQNILYQQNEVGNSRMNLDSRGLHDGDFNASPNLNNDNLDTASSPRLNDGVRNRDSNAMVVDSGQNTTDQAVGDESIQNASSFEDKEHFSA